MNHGRFSGPAYYSRHGMKVHGGQKSPLEVTFSHSLDHSVCLRSLWAAKCGQSASDNTCQLPSQSQWRREKRERAREKKTTSQFLPPVKINICKQITPITTRRPSRKTFQNSQGPLPAFWRWPITAKQTQITFSFSSSSSWKKMEIWHRLQIVSPSSNNRREREIPFWPLTQKTTQTVLSTSPSMSTINTMCCIFCVLFHCTCWYSFFAASKWWARRCCWRAADKRGASHCMFTAILEESV